jgi:hypothetical protein
MRVVGGLYQTGDCVVIELAVGQNRCAIWPGEEDETGNERVCEKISCGEHCCEVMPFFVLQLWIN